MPLWLHPNPPMACEVLVSAKMKPAFTVGLGAASVAWIFAVLAGTTLLLQHDYAECPVGPISGQWPKVQEVGLDSQKDTLLMFVHPRCPCTRASINELNRIMARANGDLVAHALFVLPHSLPQSWAETGKWFTARSIPGVTVQTDLDGKLASAFGAKTSGYVVLYNSRGQLLFQGGITSTRGHEGDNLGEDAILAYATGKDPGIHRTPVYGCLLPSQTEFSASE